MHGSFRKDDFRRRGSATSNPTEETGGIRRSDAVDRPSPSVEPASAPPNLPTREQEVTAAFTRYMETEQDFDGGCYTSDEEDAMLAMLNKQMETERQEKEENGGEEKGHDVLSNKENSGVLEADLEKKQENASVSRQVFKSGGFESPGCQGSLWNWRSETAGVGRYGSSVRWAQMEFDPLGNVTFESPGGYGYSTSYSVLLDTTLRSAFNPPSIPWGNGAFGAPRGYGYSSSYSTLDPTPRLAYGPLSLPHNGSNGSSSNRAHPSTSSSGFGSSSVAARRDENLLRAGSSARTTRFPGSPGFGNGQGTPSFVTAASVQKPVTPSSVAAPTPRESLPAVSTNNSARLGRPTEEQWRAAWAEFRTDEPVFTSWSAASSSATSTGLPGVNSSSEPVPSLSIAVRPAARTPYVVKPVVVVSAKTSIAALPLSEMPKAEKPATTVRPFVFTKATIRDAHDKNYTNNQAGTTFGPYGRQAFHSPRRQPFTPGAPTSTSVQGQAFQSNTSSHSWRPSGARGGSHGFHSPSTAASPLKPAPTASAAVKPIASVPPSSSFGSPGGSKGLGGPSDAPPSTPTPAISTAAPHNVASAHPGGSGSESPGGSNGFGCSTSSSNQSKPAPTASSADVKNVASASSSSSFESPGGSKGLGGPPGAPPSMPAPAATTAAPKSVASVPSGGSGSHGGSNGFYCSTSSSTQSKPSPTSSTADVKNVTSASLIPLQSQPRWPKPSQMTRAASPTRTNSSVAPPPVSKPLASVTAASIASSPSGLSPALPSNPAGSSDRSPLTPAAFREAVGVDQPDSSNVTTVISSNSTPLPSNSDQPAVTTTPPVEPVVAKAPSPPVAPVVRPPVNPEVVVANELDFGNLDLNEVIYDLMRNERIRDIIKNRNRALYDMMVDYITTVTIHSLNI